MESVKEKRNKAFGTLKGLFGYTNYLASPRLIKVVVSSGTGSSSKKEKTINDFVSERMSRITGQKAAPRGAKKSIASFKVREGDPIGYVVTLRKQRMYDFLDKLINVAIPRMRDFRGFDKKCVDEMGNLTLGIREHNIFPETADEELKDIFGLSVTIVTTAKNKEEGAAFFESLGIPFKK